MVWCAATESWSETTPCARPAGAMSPRPLGPRPLREREPCRRGRREGRWGRDGLVPGARVLERDDAVRSAGWSHVAEAGGAVVWFAGQR